MRDELGLTADQEVELRVRDCLLEVEPPPTPVRLAQCDGHAADCELPTLTVD